MKKPAPGRVRVFEEFRCVCCLHAGSSRTCWLGNKYEHKNRTQGGGAGIGGFDVGSRWCVVMQHVIEKTTAISAVSTLAALFPSVSAACSAIACGARMVAAESVSVNPNSLFSTGFLRGFRRFQLRSPRRAAPRVPREVPHALRCARGNGARGSRRRPMTYARWPPVAVAAKIGSPTPSLGTRPCPDVLPVPCWPLPCWLPCRCCPRPPTALPATPSPPVRR